MAMEAETGPLRSNEALEAMLRPLGPLEVMMVEMRPLRSNEAFEAVLRPLRPCMGDSQSKSSK